MPFAPLRLAASLALAGTLAGCAALMRQGEAPSSPEPTARPVPVATHLPVLPLPGSLDGTPVFNSNSPEVVTEPGVLLSLRPIRTPEDERAYLGRLFEGTFQVFSHHIAKDATPGERLLTIGLVAENYADRAVTLTLRRGSTYLSQPEALFQPLPSATDDPKGVVWAGPGDRVATDWLHGRSSVRPSVFVLPAHSSALIYSLPIPTDVAIGPPINGRTTQLEFTSTGPVALSESAVFAYKGPEGFSPPAPSEYYSALEARRMAGPRDVPPTGFTPGKPLPPGKFAYGRVAGASLGAYWNGTLEAPAPNESVAYPIATVVLNKLGTQQVQSAPMIARYGDTAFQAHGNYGVTYRLQVPLHNKGYRPVRYTFSLSNPQKVDPATTTVTYLDPPGKAVLFRGPVKLSWQPDGGARQARYTHIVLNAGQGPVPVGTITLPPGASWPVTVELVYPADATPPQLLTIEAR